MLTLIISTIISVTIKAIIEGIAWLIRWWFKRHPFDHVGFLHFKHKHDAPNPRVCEEGQCPTVVP